MGAEMLIKALLNMAGLQIDDVRKAVNDGIVGLKIAQEKANDIEARINRIEKLQEKILSALTEQNTTAE